MLADRVVKRDWYRKRGERAIDARASDAIDEVIEGEEDRQAREVERLAPLLDEDSDALRQLRAFPAGITYLLGQFSIFAARLAGNRNLLGSQRRRCFSLIGKKVESVSPRRSCRHPVAWRRRSGSCRARRGAWKMWPASSGGRRRRG